MKQFDPHKQETNWWLEIPVAILSIMFWFLIATGVILLLGNLIEHTNEEGSGYLSIETNEQKWSTEELKVLATQNVVLKERQEQFTKWGSQAFKPDHIWALILMEEFGELVDEYEAGNSANALTESIQLAAVSNAWAEAIKERGYKRNTSDFIEQAITTMFSNIGRLAKALLENNTNEAYLFAMSSIVSVSNLRDKIELLQFSAIEIDPSRPSIESSHEDHVDFQPDCTLCANAYHEDSKPKDQNV